MKILRNTFLAMAAFAALITSSCSKDDSGTPGPSATSHKVQFKAQASAGANISVAVYGYDANTSTVTSLSGATWSSPEITVPAGAINVNAAVNAIGTSAASSLKVQVYIDGAMKKEGTASGEILSASVNYTF